VIDRATAQAALEMLEVDAHGFDELDRRLLRTIIEKYDGGPVGLNTLAAALAEEQDALEEVYEPFLIQIGFLDRTPRGRVATRLAYEHLGIEMPRKLSLFWVFSGVGDGRFCWGFCSFWGAERGEMRG
jgi:holliday junction DNA helicase RuvB